jgi:hypothetical protein
MERYSPERIAEFLLSTATSPSDYRWACEEVRKLGLDPDSVSRHRPDAGLSQVWTRRPISGGST